jgi:uncharacterized protein (DUF952 family)
MDGQTTIYKLMTREEWEAAKAAGVFRGSAHDLRDGYIHFSAAAQLKETALKYFSGTPDLVLLAVDIERLNGVPSKLRWEPSRGGDLFPHLYADLPVTAVVRVAPVPLASDGTPLLPENLAT